MNAMAIEKAIAFCMYAAFGAVVLYAIVPKNMLKRIAGAISWTAKTFIATPLVSFSKGLLHAGIKDIDAEILATFEALQPDHAEFDISSVTRVEPMCEGLLATFWVHKDKIVRRLVAIDTKMVEKLGGKRIPLPDLPRQAPESIGLFEAITVTRMTAEKMLKEAKGPIPALCQPKKEARTA